MQAKLFTVLAFVLEAWFMVVFPGLQISLPLSNTHYRVPAFASGTDSHIYYLNYDAIVNTVVRNEDANDCCVKWRCYGLLWIFNEPPWILPCEKCVGLLLTRMHGEGFFYSEGTWRRAALEGILFRPFDLASSILFYNFGRAKGSKFSNIGLGNSRAWCAESRNFTSHFQKNRVKETSRRLKFPT